jgi:hypothetical protein
MFRSVVTRGLLIVASVAAYSPPLAAQSSFPVTGSIQKACSLSAASVALQVVNNNNAYTTSFSPNSVTAWCNTAGTLSISSTRLLKSGTTTTFADYILTVSGWGSAMTYTTAASPPTATTQSGAAGSTSLSFACKTASSPSGCTGAPFAKNTTWNATITLALTPN